MSVRARGAGLLRRLTPRRALDHATRPLRFGVRRLSAGGRGLPDFIIVGAQKAGTTSLFRYLCAHPSVAEPLRKETHYFDVRYDKGTLWYRAHFPRLSHLRQGGGTLITGEATANYLFDLRAPERIARTVPEARLLVLLRDPVARAHSHYRHNVRIGRETRSFEQAIDKEWSGDFSPPRERHFAYLQKSIYERQLSRWMELFGPQRMRVLWSRDLFENPRQTSEETMSFLSLSPADVGPYAVHNPGLTLRLDAETENRLRGFFEPHEERLREKLRRWGRDGGVGRSSPRD